MNHFQPYTDQLFGDNLKTTAPYLQQTTTMSKSTADFYVAAKTTRVKPIVKHFSVSALFPSTIPSERFNVHITHYFGIQYIFFSIVSWMYVFTHSPPPNVSVSPHTWFR